MADLSGHICLVTGATRGIGRATAEALARMGAHVLLHGRDSASVGAVCREMVRYGQITGVVGDLSSLAAVRKLAKDIAAQHPRLDVLVNNAGTGSLDRNPTADGFERQFAVNHLAPFLLTNLLLDKLKASKAARVVTVSSMAHRSGKLDFDDLNWEKRKYSRLGAYGASKLANILFTIELARRLAGSHVTANSLHPGVVATNIFSTMGGVGGRAFIFLLRPFLLSPANGAKTSVYLASSPEVANVTGKFFDKCREVAPAPAAQDAAAARLLWEISERLTGLASSAKEPG
jgi:NAD(P)-dependent dehydrogenase (short-subunit alcohol dehydrogenase family)